MGTLQIDTSERRALLHGTELPVTGRAFDLLVALVERRDRLSTRSELLHCVWGDQPVDDANLTVQIASLRRVLGPQSIVTVPGRGYHFVHPSPPAEPGGPASEPKLATPSRLNSAPALPLIGRDQDLAVLRGAMEGSRLVTLFGPGGVGKTTLARAAVDGLRVVGTRLGWVPLESLEDPATLASTVGRALQLELLGSDPTLALVKALKAQQLQLAVLDGVERWAAAVAELAEAVLKAVPALRLLVTSQVPLHLPAEQLQRLHPLKVPRAGASLEQAQNMSAVQLFVERGRAADHRFALHQSNVEVVGQICRQVEGLPLAIEMTAYRVATLGAFSVARDLAKHLGALRTSHRDSPERHRSLRATAMWTWQLLSERAQRVFRRLSVCVDDFSLELAQAVAGKDAGLREPWDVVDVLAELVDASLLVVKAQNAPRYEMLSTTRWVAQEQLQEFGEGHEARRRHAYAMASIYDQLREQVHLRPVVPYDEILGQYATEASNGLVAFEWAIVNDPNTAVALSIGLLRTNEVDHVTKTSICRRSRALLGPEIDPLLQMKRSHVISYLDREMIAEEPHVRRALAVARECGNEYELAETMLSFLTLRIVALEEEQRRMLPEIMRLHAAHPEWHPAIRSAAARRLRHLFPLDEHLAILQRAAALAREGGASGRAQYVDFAVALTLMRCGKYDEAIALSRELERTLLDTRHLCACRLVLMISLIRNDQLEEAQEAAQRGWQGACAWDLQADWTVYLALLALARRDMPLAATLLACSDVRFGKELERWREVSAVAEEIRLATAAALDPSVLRHAQAQGAVLTDEGVAILLGLPWKREGA
jgi:predicted ATPase/DNA-binding winged helix-turn-helix (wHTH) protein